MNLLRAVIAILCVAVVAAAAEPVVEFAHTTLPAPDLTQTQLAMQWRHLTESGQPFVVRLAHGATVAATRTGLRWIAPVPPRGYIVAATAPDAPQPAGLAWCGPLPPAAKLSAGSGRPDAAKRLLVHRASTRAVKLSADASTLDAVLNDPSVWLVEPARPALTTANRNIRHIVGADFLQGDAAWSLRGGDVTLGVVDEGPVEHADFAGRLTNRDTGDVSEHTTHVCGTLAGSGFASEGLYRGVAPDATLVVWNFDDPIGDMPDVIARDVNWLNNSWVYFLAESEGNCDYVGAYDSFTADYDRVVSGEFGRPLGVSFAAGNMAGSAVCGAAERDDFATLPPPATAKNVIAVGSADGGLDVSWFSSRGPTNDGRTKPDLVAPGCMPPLPVYIVSTAPGGGYAGPGWCGTSMAAAQVTAAGGLLTELAAQDEIELTPALVKALLVASARDIDRPGPDFRSGWGELDVVAAAAMLRFGGFATPAALDGNDPLVMTLDVAQGTPALEITLVWDDPAASPSAARVLVNDLNLRLLDPVGDVHLPWLLDPDDPAAPAIVGIDEVNNVEQLRVASPIGGVWTLFVEATDLMAAQPFALAGWALSDTECDADGDRSPGAACDGNDCDDADSAIHPGAVETLDNGVDEDCDGLIDEDFPGASADYLEQDDTDDDDDSAPTDDDGAGDDNDSGCGC